MNTKKITMTALMAALCYIGFQVFKIDFAIGEFKTAIHLGNAFCVLAALMLGGLEGGLAGAIGMSIADLTAGFPQSFPKTFLMKFMIGFIVGTIAHKIGHVNNHTDDSKYIFKWGLISSLAGMGFNVIFDPIISYLYKRFLLQTGAEAAAIFATWTSITTIINAVLSIVIATLLFTKLAKITKKYMNQSL